MKKTMTLLSAIAIMALAFTVSEAKSFKLDAKNTSVEWTGEKVTGSHMGTVPVQSGELTVEKGVLTGGQITMDMSQIVCSDLDGEGKQKLEGHLKSEDFFGVDKHPTSKLNITAVNAVKGEAHTHMIDADLTIKGKTDKVSFPATLEVSDKMVSGSAEITFDRTKWDIKYNSGSFFDGLGDYMIYDDVKLKVTISAK